MGQFKPMVKMMTTEPTVELKLKKGGTVKGHKNMKSGGCMKSGGKADATGHSYMNGGISAALAGEPMIAPRRRRMPPAAIARPSMAERRAAMAGAKAGAKAGARQGALAQMTGGMKEGGESSKEHKSEMTKMSAIEKKMKSHEDKPASKAHAGLKTGGVAKGKAGYKTGGVVKGQGGYKTGGVVMGQGGYKKGGSAKKFAEGGTVQDDGRPQKMAQGAKKPSSPVEINKLSGTFKKGGKVKKYGGGGDVELTIDEKFASPEEQLKEMRRRKAMREGYGQVSDRERESNEEMLEYMTSMPKSLKNLAKRALRGKGAVTDTETTVSRTVVPAKKHGGKAKK